MEARNDTGAAAGHKPPANGYDAGMNANFHPPALPRRFTAPRRRANALIAALAASVAAAVFALPLAAQPKLAQGILLVATPEIGDPSWTRTVVLLLHHDSNGSLGIAINRPTRVTPEEIVPEFEWPDYDGSVFRGGPVNPTQLVFLVRNPPLGLLRAAPQIFGEIYASGDLDAFAELVERGSTDGELRLYAGHVEWAPRQLEAEVAEGLWTVTAASAPRVFSARPETLWDQLRESGNELLVDAANEGLEPSAEAAASEANRGAPISLRRPLLRSAASSDPR